MKLSQIMMAIACAALCWSVAGGVSARVLVPLWVTPTASKGPPVTGGGRVFVWDFASGSPGQAYLIYALDAASGKILWSAGIKQTPRRLDPVPDPFLALEGGFEGRVLLLKSSAGTKVQDGATGQALSGGLSRRFLSLQEMVFETGLGFAIDSEKRQLRALAEKSHQVVWSASFAMDEARLGVVGASRLHYGEGQVIVQTPFERKYWTGISAFGFRLTAFEAMRGAVQWTFTAGDSDARSGVLSGGTTDTSLSELRRIGGRIYLTVDQTHEASTARGGTRFSIQKLIALDAQC